MTFPTVPTGSAVLLHALPRGARACIERLAEPRDEAGREVLLRLIEIGFLPGETVHIVAKGRAGGEPIAVRLGGQSTFALRAGEAALVQVRALGGESA
ncbi:MAG: ferrous iron transport protein A [Burkholderiaceae bacterium]|jgi:ferrous iron transport protein A|nr:ferrous iron transport protein A [Burkholderiaceae bacterium]